MLFPLHVIGRRRRLPAHTQSHSEESSHRTHEAFRRLAEKSAFLPACQVARGVFESDENSLFPGHEVVLVVAVEKIPTAAAAADMHGVFRYSAYRWLKLYQRRESRVLLQMQIKALQKKVTPLRQEVARIQTNIQIATLYLTQPQELPDASS